MTFWDGTRWQPETPTSPRSGIGHRTARVRDVIATAAMVVGLVAAVLPFVPAIAGVAVLNLSPAAGTPGQTVHLTGSGFPAATWLKVMWDGSTGGMPSPRVSRAGTFSTSFVVPSAAAGSHTVAVAPVSSKSPKRTSTLAAPMAAVTFTLTAPANAPEPTNPATPSPTAPPAAAPTPAPSPTSAPTSAPQPSPTQPQPTPTAAPVTPAPTATPTAPPAPPAPITTGFVVACGVDLCLDGAPYRFTGFSIYNANSRWNCWYPLGFADAELATTVTAIGPDMEAFRAWFYQGLAGTATARDWAAFDHTLAVARAHGVRVIASLSGEGGDCKDYPVDQHKYEAWYATGYSQPEASGQSYLDWVRAVVSRYRNDPTILAWQMMGEAEDPIDASGTCSATANQTMKAWADTTAGVIKSIDTNHLVTIGVIGSGQCGASGTAFTDLHAGPNIDVCTREDYGEPNSPMPGDAWNGMQIRIDECHALGKPLFVSESGLQRTVPNRAAKWDAKFAAQFSAGVVGELIWDWSIGPLSDGYEVLPGDPALTLLSRY